MSTTIYFTNILIIEKLSLDIRGKSEISCNVILRAKIQNLIIEAKFDYCRDKSQKKLVGYETDLNARKSKGEGRHVS